MINSLLNKGKDLALSMAMKKVINMKIINFGEVSMLEFNTESKTIDFEVELKGEIDKLKVYVHEYNLKNEGEKHYLTVNYIESSKEWLNSILKEYVNNQKIEVPSEYVKVLKAVI
ncbi:MAG: hypothetical protein ACWA5P_02155 [bacterium]